MNVGNINFLLLVPKGALKKNMLIITRVHIFVVMLLLSSHNNCSLVLTELLQSEYIIDFSCFIKTAMGLTACHYIFYVTHTSPSRIYSVIFTDFLLWLGVSQVLQILSKLRKNILATMEMGL